MEAPFIRSARRRFWPSRDHDPSGARDLLECFKMERDGLGKRGIRLLGRGVPVVLFGRRWTWAWAPCNGREGAVNWSGPCGSGTISGPGSWI